MWPPAWTAKLAGTFLQLVQAGIEWLLAQYPRVEF